MRVLIDNIVKTDKGDYTFGSREEAEAFYMTLKTERPDPEAAADEPPRGARRGESRNSDREGS